MLCLECGCIADLMLMWLGPGCPRRLSWFSGCHMSLEKALDVHTRPSLDFYTLVSVVIDQNHEYDWMSGPENPSKSLRLGLSLLDVMALAKPPQAGPPWTIHSLVTLPERRPISRLCQIL